MKILVTGTSGFLGSEIVKALKNEKVITLARKNASICLDLSKKIPKISAVDIVVHAAGKAHSISKTEEEKRSFFDTNVTGVLNLLNGLEKTSPLPRAFIFISSVAVYGVDTGNYINENQPLCATDPYGLSKIDAEKNVINWCFKNDITCAILRLPLIAGTNPPGNLKAMINGIKNNYYFNINGGRACKSMVLAEDVAKIIPVAANVGGIYNLTDGYHPSFLELSQVIAKQLGKSKPLNIPMWAAKLIAMIGDLIGSKSPINSYKLIKITSNLTFDDSKARRLLGWNPTGVLKGFKI